MGLANLLTFTVMKNEGPFILEWVAYQKMMGVGSILVMSNDCDDGTDLILDRLEDLGLVRHLPNPSVLSDAMRSNPHGVGIQYAHMLREWRAADYIFLSDVDEFPVVRMGNGSLQALLEHTGYPDVLSLNEMLFGTSGLFEFSDELVTQSFTRRTKLSPGETDRARRGLKSITRNRPGILKIRNHRPVCRARRAEGLRWLDGSGNSFPIEFRHVHEKGIDCRGRTDLAVINHYTLRSVESFLVKLARGDAVAPDRLNLRYFRRRNGNDEECDAILPMIPRLQEELAKLKQDTRLADLHDQAVAAHRAKITAIRQSPDFAKVLAALNLAPPVGGEMAA